MITEVYMGPGDFRVSMRVETPWLMQDITPGGYLVILPQYPGDPRMFTNDALLDAARYTGIVLETIWRNGILTLEGAGLDWILGDLDGVGWPCPSRTYSSTAFATVFSLIAGGGIIPPAFTIGSTITGTSYSGTHGTSETIKDVVMQVMDQLDNHYKIDPDGTINSEGVGAGNVYVDDPEIVFMRTNWGSDANWTGLPVDSLSSAHSAREWIDTGDLTIYGLTNSAIDRSDTTSPLTTREIFGSDFTMNEIRLPYNQLAGTGAAVGDVVYVWDPGSGFTGGGADIIKFRGEYLQPVQHRIQEVTWPLVEGMGVFYRPGQGSAVDSEDWIDLTATARFTAASRAQTYVRALVLPESGGGG